MADHRDDEDFEFDIDDYSEDELIALFRKALEPDDNGFIDIDRGFELDSLDSSDTYGHKACGDEIDLLYKPKHKMTVKQLKELITSDYDTLEEYVCCIEVS